MGYIGIIGCILGLYRDNRKENGNYSIVYCFFRDIEKEHGNYYITYWGYIGVIEKRMETTMMGYVGGLGSRMRQQWVGAVQLESVS